MSKEVRLLFFIKILPVFVTSFLSYTKKDGARKYIL